MLLPFLEMSSRYSEFTTRNSEFVTSTSTINGFNPLRVNDKVSCAFAMGPISALLCPSDPGGRELCFHTDEGRRVSRTNLVVSRGEQMFNSELDHGSNPVLNPYANTDDFNSRNRSMFVRRLWRGVNYCTDGTSNTIAVSEVVTPDTNASNMVLGGIIILPSGSPLRKDGDNSNCSTRRSGSTLVPGTGSIAKEANRGGSWMFGSAVSNGFHTVNPPNTPNCIWGSDGYYTWGLYPPSSHHPGGVNVAFFDGSCRFITEVIDSSGLNGQRNEGPSTYGVWGALGTPDGGETASL
jgi:prepilin-type processing-associated H-X9-DG protein